MPSTSLLNSRQLALRCAEAALDKKAENLEILDLRGLSSFTDFFVVASGNSEPHLKAIAEGVQETLRKDLEQRPSRVDGFPMSQWVVMDYGDVLVHLFHEKKRSLYALEDLWGDAPRVPLNAGADSPQGVDDPAAEEPQKPAKAKRPKAKPASARAKRPSAKKPRAKAAVKKSGKASAS